MREQSFDDGRYRVLVLVEIGRAEKDRKKLTDLYEQSYAYAKEKSEQIIGFLEIKQQAIGGF